MNKPKQKIEYPGLRGKHHVISNGKEVLIDGHVFKRTVLPRPTSMQKDDDELSELDTVDQKLIQEIQPDAENINEQTT